MAGCLKGWRSLHIPRVRVCALCSSIRMCVHVHTHKYSAYRSLEEPVRSPELELHWRAVMNFLVLVGGYRWL